MPKRAAGRAFKLFQNPTKLKVVVLLSEGQPMTVTQMSKLIGSSRPNLYHVVSEMVSEGFLVKPTTKVKGNYVEKYYDLSPDAFGKFDPDEHRRSIAAASAEEFRDLVHSILLSVSMNAQIMAGKLETADKDAVDRLSKARKSDTILAGFFTLSDGAYEDLVKGWRGLFLKTIKKWGDDKTEGKNTLAIYGLPYFGKAKPSRAARTVSSPRSSSG